MLKPEKEGQNDSRLRELLDAMDKEIAEFRRLKDGGPSLRKGPLERGG